MTEHVVATLRDDIVQGRLPPGSAVPLEVVSERFGVSPIPVREALRTLDGEGLVVLRPHRTATVAEVRLDEAEDLYRVRILLETEAARRAAARLDPARLDELRQVAADLARARGGQDLGLRAALHRELHLGIYEAADSPTLLAMFTMLWERTERIRLVVRGADRAAAPPRNNHLVLLDALATGDPEPAAEAVRGHLQTTVDRLYAALPHPSTPTGETDGGGAPEGRPHDARAAPGRQST